MDAVVPPVACKALCVCVDGVLAPCRRLRAVSLVWHSNLPRTNSSRGVSELINMQ